jgi:choline dehydrogenase-like flavoprotein
MDINATDITPGQRIHAGVCIVGAGPVGLTLARELAEQGLDVLVLERGAASTLHDLVTDGVVLAPSAQRVVAPRGRDNARPWNPGEPYPLAESRGRGIGGSSWKWGWGGAEHGYRAQLPPFDAADFEVTLPGLGGWPLGYDEVAACFARAAEHCGLPRLEDRPPTSWLTAPGLVAKHYRFGRSTAFWVEAADALRASPRVRLLSGAYVLELQCDADGRTITALRVAAKPGREFTVEADRVVLATGGIENARLLLASRVAPHADGIGNAHGMVGRCFMEHLNHDVGYLVPRKSAWLQDPLPYALHVLDGDLIQRKYQLDPGLRQAHGLPNVVYQLNPTRITKHEIAAWHTRRIPGRKALAELRSRGIAEIARLRTLQPVLVDAPALVRGVAALAAGKLLRRLDQRARALIVRGSAEQYPDRASRVALTDQRDDFGVPVVTLHWRVSAADQERIFASQRRLGAVLEQQGVGKLFASHLHEDREPQIGVGFHHMGTTRMSGEPHHGVVDRDCRVHGMTNLYVAGASVFTTGGSANPTFTAIALAVRLADHLAACDARQETRTNIDPTEVSGGALA